MSIKKLAVGGVLAALLASPFAVSVVSAAGDHI